jgi:uncharacterized protein (TIGR03435 family)
MIMLQPALGFIVFSTAIQAHVQATNSDAPQFEVAAIHPINPKQGDAGSGCSDDPVLLRCSNVTLKRCIVGAYGIGGDRVLGGPDWIDTSRFQITAHADQPADDKAMMVMLQTLLSQRFNLLLHRESRVRPAMLLEVARSGPTIRVATDGDVHSYKNMYDHLEATKITMAEFAEIISRDLDLPVVDGTALAGSFNFTLHWNRNDASVSEREEGLAIRRADMAEAILKQLGLTLKVRKMPVDVLVIDHAEKPVAEQN